MRYVSTRGRAQVLGFDDVLVRGLAPDGGLYMPERWPRAEVSDEADYVDVATEFLTPFVNGSVVEGRLSRIVRETYSSFRHPEVAPLREISPNRYLLELFWGPTLSFKDYALQLVGRLFDAVLGERDDQLLILGATSGDTGSAAIEACRDRSSLRTVILFPEGRVTEFQRRQMTTVDSDNVWAVSVQGTFDDCQDLVKQAFGNEPLRQRLSLGAVNSINWARVMAQVVYYAWTYATLGRPFAAAVPTGNFGNVLAGYVARLMGVGLERLIVANNANHGVSDLVTTGRLELVEVKPTFAPAMDIAVPSNLERLLFELWDRDPAKTESAMIGLRTGRLILDELTHERLRGVFGAHWSDDTDIADTIRRVEADHGIVIDPHTATAWRAADSEESDLPIVTVATAHPAKFADVIESALGMEPEPPAELSKIMELPETIHRIPNDARALEDLLNSL